MNICDIGDILIPELKPTKKEGEYLSREYKDVKYFYQPVMSKNINLENLNPQKIISNYCTDGLSLENLNIVFVGKE